MRHAKPRRIMRGRLAAAFTALALAVGLAGQPGATAAPGGTDLIGADNSHYVALGDSFVSSPLTGMPVGLPFGCDRTQNNYPRQVAAVIQPENFTDASCGGATMENLFHPQQVPLGVNPAQLDAVTATTTLVTIGIGGNDLGLYGWLSRCGRVRYDECMKQLTPVQTDALGQQIAHLAVRFNEALTVIGNRAPKARVLVVGYPVVAPITGTGCTPQFPYADSRISYYRDVQQRLNALLDNLAYLHDATYVDAYETFIGHDPCQMPGVRWIEGLMPDSPAASLHPNLMGQTALADEVLAALDIYRR